MHVNLHSVVEAVKVMLLKFDIESCGWLVASKSHTGNLLVIFNVIFRLE